MLAYDHRINVVVGRYGARGALIEALTVCGLLSATMIVGAQALVRLVPASSQHTTEHVERCVAEQFAVNGFESISSYHTGVDGAVSGTFAAKLPITISFRNDDAAAVTVNKSSIDIASVDHGFAAVHQLTTSVQATCLRQKVESKMPKTTFQSE